jgi:hypothetical protein
MISTPTLIKQVSRRHDPHSPIEEAIRNRLNVVCQSLKPTVISRISGMSVESHRRYMRGDKPSVLFVARLCHALNLSVDWLLLGRGEPENARPASESQPTGALAERHVDEIARLLAELRFEAGFSVDFADSARAHQMDVQNSLQVRLVLGQADGHTLEF